MTTRKPVKIIKGVHTTDGAGVKLVRLFGGETLAREFDPFLMLDGFDSREPADYAAGFPWHPHRGIETITYLIRGQLEHRDSLGTIGTINSGDVQWMTAGRGIVHQEMPQEAEHMLGIQLWLNLPREHKMTKPHYGDILHHAIPEVTQDGSVVRVIAGKYLKTQGAFTGKYVTPTFLDVRLDAQADWQLKTNSEHTVFIYVVSGSVHTNSQEIAAKHVVLFGKGDTLELTGGKSGAQVLVFAAKPLGEPIAWGGPVVMNTRAELQTAFEQIQNGSFIAEE